MTSRHVPEFMYQSSFFRSKPVTRQIITLLSICIVLFGLVGSLALIRYRQDIYSRAAPLSPTGKTLTQQLGPLNFYGKKISYLQLFGQLDYTQASKQMTQRNAAFHASGVAVTRAVKPTAVYLMDRGNSRVLGWRGVGYCKATTTSCTVEADCAAQELPENRVCIVDQNKPPDIVLGQPDFQHSACNGDANLGIKATPSVSTLCTMTFPWGGNVAEQWMRIGLATDSQGNLFVPDVENDRILRYNNPLSQASKGGAGDAVPDIVIGQDNYTKNGKNGGSFFELNTPPTARHLFLSTGPGVINIASRGVFVDSADNLWVADTYNNRVLRFPPNQTEPDLVLGQSSFTEKGCDVANPRKLCFPTQITADPTTGDIYVADEMGIADFEARIVVFSPPFTNGMANTRVIRPSQSGPFENWGSFDGKGTYTPEITGLSFGPNLETGQTVLPQLYLNGHADNRLLQLDRLGTITTSLGSHSVIRRGGDTEYEGQYPGCGSIRTGGKLWWPGGSVGIDEENNMYLAEEFFHRVVRYQLPYQLVTLPNGVKCLPNPSGVLLSTGPNVQDPRGFGDMLGTAVYGNQLLVLDQYMKLKVWNDYLTKPTFASPDFELRKGLPDRAKIAHAIDNKGRLWMNGEHGRLRIFQLPLQPESTALVDWVKLYWADTKELVNLEYVTGATFDAIGKQVYIIDHRGTRVLRISNYDDVHGQLLVDRVFGQTDKKIVLCNRGLETPDANSLCGVIQVAFDKAGNLFLLDNNYECHRNNRILAYSRETLIKSSESLFFSAKPDYIIGAQNASSFGSCDGNQVGFPVSPVSIEFDRDDRMIIANDGMYGDQQREWKQLWMYENPFAIHLPYSEGFAFLRSPAANIELPLGASGDVLFDTQNNMLVQDHTWSRLWIINYFTDREWIKQLRPWRDAPPTPPPSPPPTPPPSPPVLLPDLYIKQVMRKSGVLGPSTQEAFMNRPRGYYSVEVCNAGKASPQKSYFVSFVAEFGTSRRPSKLYQHLIPSRVPAAGKCRIFTGISCDAIGDTNCRTATDVTVIADSTNQIPEASEKNNSRHEVFGIVPPNFGPKPTPIFTVPPRPKTTSP